jgi:FLVCR family MFS transporter
MCFTACAIRSLPCLLPPSQRRSPSAQLLLHAGQIVNAAVGPIVMSSPSLLSARWFPPHRRATATSVAYLGGNLGGAVGFLLGPCVEFALRAEGNCDNLLRYIIADSADNLPRFLLVELLMAALPLLLLTVHSPAPPATIHWHEQGCSSQHQPLLLPLPPPDCHSVSKPTATPVIPKSSLPLPPAVESAAAYPLLRILSLPSLLLLCACGGVQAGVSSAWTGVLPQMLPSPPFSPIFIGWLGCAFSIGGVVGNAGAGLVADRWFVQRYKTFLIRVFMLSAACFGVLTLSLHNPFITPAPIPSSPASIMIIGSLAGVLQSACDPLFYELAAEISFPLEEGSSASMIAFLFNAATLVMLFVAPAISLTLFNAIMTATMVVCALGVCFTKESYHRRAAALARTNCLAVN